MGFHILWILRWDIEMVVQIYSTEGCLRYLGDVDDIDAWERDEVDARYGFFGTDKS
jgi:hypothetical protein